MKKKMFLISLVIVIITSGVITFICVSNNHLECETSTVITYGDNGENTTTKTHHCKEKFNL